MAKKNTNKHQMFNMYEIEKQIMKAIKEKNEYLQLKLLNQYFSIIPIETADFFYQNQYAFLMKKMGKVHYSIALSKNVLNNNTTTKKLYASENLINSYLYLNNYEKAEEYLNLIIEQNKEAFNQSNILLCFLEIKRKKKSIVPSYLKNKYAGYYQSQIIRYEKKKFYNYMQTYFNGDRNYNQFSNDFTLNELEKIVGEALPIAIKSPDSYAVDFYYFDLCREIGIDKENKKLTGIKVATLKNTNQLLAIEPIDVINTDKIIAINKFPYRREQEEKKVFYKSQIDKFNRRYNKI